MEGNKLKPQREVLKLREISMGLLNQMKTLCACMESSGSSSLDAIHRARNKKESCGAELKENPVTFRDCDDNDFLITQSISSGVGDPLRGKDDFLIA